MEQHKLLEKIRLKIAKGNATFTERNILRIAEKKAAKAQRQAKQHAPMPTRSTKRFGSC